MGRLTANSFASTATLAKEQFAWYYHQSQFQLVEDRLQFIDRVRKKMTRYVTVVLQTTCAAVHPTVYVKLLDSITQAFAFKSSDEFTMWRWRLPWKHSSWNAATPNGVPSAISQAQNRYRQSRLPGLPLLSKNRNDRSENLRSTSTKRPAVMESLKTNGQLGTKVLNRHLTSIMFTSREELRAAALLNSIEAWHDIASAPSAASLLLGIGIIVILVDFTGETLFDRENRLLV